MFCGEIKSARRDCCWSPYVSNMKVNALSKIKFNHSTSNSVHEINYVYFVFLVIVKKYKPAVGMKTTSNFNKRTADSAGSELRQKRINCRSIGKCKYPISDHNSPWSETKQRLLIDIYARWSSILTEMPASGELKSGDPLFFTTPPPEI